jgi:hypothetical protein
VGGRKWRAVRDRCDDDTLASVHAIHRQYNGAGSVLCAFIVTLTVFVAPKISVADDEAGLWIWNVHSELLVCQFVIEDLARLGRHCGFQGLDKVSR